MNLVTPKLLESVRHENVESKLAPSLDRRRLRTYALILIADAALFNLAFALGSLVWEGRWAEPRAMLAAQAMLPAFFTIAFYNSSYGLKALSDWLFATRKALIALVISAGLINFVAFYTKSNEDFSRAAVTLGLLFTAIMLFALRWSITMLIQWRWNGRIANRLVIDDDGSSFLYPDAVAISARAFNLDPGSHDPFMLDRLGKLLRNQDHVVISCPRERREQWAFMLKSAGVYGEIVSEPAHSLGAVGVHRYAELDRTTLVVSTGPLGLRSRIVKRAFDIAVAAAGLLVLSPLLLAVALLIKLEDGGPVLFVQRRLGRGNQFFEMRKFRSMREEKLDHDGERSTARDDDRITRIGAFMRRTSIDELPQLINVLRGEMSIVGPRPHALGSRANNKFFWEVDRKYWQRHCLKPGLTGLAQVRGHRGATEFEKDLTDRLQSDLEYIAKWSLMRDIKIVLRTVMVLKHDNAY
ncbi:sugar transferase [Erythrobacter sanguineus]|uniref:Sugar transferase involved in LPS biosynthesis (Colanic, teichoic acid) n=1 Tax=Erythrobacter sanguineus TaxID=198312 RepID=A0A1M7SC42_9SPHN|nr:sugar transferase [Erythrobacter sanguineus]SHN56061.1 Sugar transferase involved in LPS biosynthesis (colanic, teichoic acid) [Erythrobacter sanguineus]